MADWRWPNFTRQEMTCHCGCGRCEMDAGFMDTLQAIRTVYGQPMKVTSAYRCPEYNARLKGGPEHPKGMAVDIEVGNPDAMELIVIALAHGVRRIGVAQKAGKPRFLHIGGSKELPVAIWSY